MDKDYQKEVAKTAVEFMLRVPLKGSEVPAFNIVMNYLDDVIKQKDEGCPIPTSPT